MNKPPLSQAVLELLTPHWLFARLNIASKMLLGYMMLVVLTVIVVSYALVSLQKLNQQNKAVITVAIPVQEAADKMHEAILAQDSYEKRFLILKRTDIRNLFWKRGEEFDTLLAKLTVITAEGDLPLKKLDKLHRQYSDLFIRETKMVKDGSTAAASAISNGELKDKLDDLLVLLRAMSADAKIAQENGMKRISMIGGSAFATTAMLCIFSILAGALAGLVVTHHISSSIHKLSVGTERIAEGQFDYDPGITTHDEIGTLSDAFRAMGRRLLNLEEMYLDASPLTRMPGGIAIENVLKRRLDSGQPIAFCVMDLDNFKAFNDHYGYAHGNDVLKAAGAIIETATRVKGAADDFVGHIGGDDFVVISTPAHMRDISAEIIHQFDEQIPQFYEPEDRENRYIFGKNRQGVEMKFPFMTISIAIVTNIHRKLTNSLETAEIAAELKDYAKTINKSVYVVDQRRSV